MELVVHLYVLIRVLETTIIRFVHVCSPCVEYVMIGCNIDSINLAFFIEVNLN